MLPVPEQTVHDVSAAYMCGAPRTGRSNRQAHVVPLSSSVPQVSARGEKSTLGSVASFCSVYQPYSALYLRREEMLRGEGSVLFMLQ